MRRETDPQHLTDRALRHPGHSTGTHDQVPPADHLLHGAAAAIGQHERTRAARYIIRAVEQADREHLLEMLGLTHADAEQET